MDEKELKRLKELETKGENRTADENVDFENLLEKQGIQAGLKAGMETLQKDMGLLKSMVETSTKSKDESNPGFAMHDIVRGIYRNDDKILAKYAPKTKAADPMLEAGSVLVPTISAAEILEYNVTYGQARQYMNVMPMTGKPINIPREAVLPTWTWGISENTSITSSKPTTDYLTLTPYKGGAIVVLTSELFEDSIVSLGNYIIKKVGQAKGTGEDQQFFGGTGSPFTGVFKSTNTFGGTNVATTTGDPSSLSYINLLSCIANVDQNFLKNAAFYAHRTIMPYVWGMVDLNNRPIYEPAFGDRPATLLGIPIRWTENSPSYTTAKATSGTPFILLGDLQNSTIGDVNGMAVKILTEATIDGTNLAQYDLVGIRVLARTAFTPGLTKTYSVIVTG